MQDEVRCTDAKQILRERTSDRGRPVSDEQDRERRPAGLRAALERRAQQVGDGLDPEWSEIPADLLAAPDVEDRRPRGLRERRGLRDRDGLGVNDLDAARVRELGHPRGMGCERERRAHGGRLVGLDFAQCAAQALEQGLGLRVAPALLIGLTARLVEGLLLDLVSLLQRFESTRVIDELRLVRSERLDEPRSLEPEVLAIGLERRHAIVQASDFGMGCERLARLVGFGRPRGQQDGLGHEVGAEARDLVALDLRRLARDREGRACFAQLRGERAFGAGRRGRSGRGDGGGDEGNALPARGRLAGRRVRTLVGRCRRGLEGFAGAGQGLAAVVLAQSRLARQAFGAGRIEQGRAIVRGGRSGLRGARRCFRRRRRKRRIASRLESAVPTSGFLARAGRTGNRRGVGQQRALRFEIGLADGRGADGFRGRLGRAHASELRAGALAAARSIPDRLRCLVRHAESLAGMESWREISVEARIS